MSSTARTCALAAALMGVAIAVVHLRAEQTRCAARILTLESKWVQLRRQWWTLQTRAARLRTPLHLRERVTSFQVLLTPPAGGPVQPRSGVRLAYDRPTE